MNARIAAVRLVTLVKLQQRIAWRVIEVFDTSGLRLCQT